MKLIMALVLVTSVSFAATKTTTNETNKMDIRVPIKKWFKANNNKFVIGFAQGTLDTNIRGRSNGFDQSSNESRNSKMQIHFGWQEVETYKFRYNAFFTYTDIQDGLSDLNGENSEDIRSMRWSANATYGVNPDVYTYAGLNWNKYYGSGDIESNIDRGIGYQAGIGFNLHERATVEVEYLALQNEGRIDDVNINVEAKGIMLKLNTPFRFDI